MGGLAGLVGGGIEGIVDAEAGGLVVLRNGCSVGLELLLESGKDAMEEGGVV